jgi:ShK domain-like
MATTTGDEVVSLSRRRELDVTRKPPRHVKPFKQLHQVPDCKDEDEKCNTWGNGGYCLKNPAFMMETCKATCGLCYYVNLEKVESAVRPVPFRV